MEKLIFIDFDLVSLLFFIKFAHQTDETLEKKNLNWIFDKRESAGLYRKT